MDDSESHQTKAFASPAVAVVGVLSLLPFYVLSIGPFIWLLAHDYLPKKPALIYTPLVAIAESWPAFDKLLRWYISFWQ